MLWGKDKLLPSSVFWESDLSARALNILGSYDIQTAEQLATYSEKELKKIRNCGHKTICDLRIFLRQHHLDLAKSDPPIVENLQDQVAALKMELAKKDLEIKQLREIVTKKYD